MKIDPALKQWATEAQARYIDAVIEHGGVRKAARALGVHHSTVLGAISAATRRSAIQPRGTPGFVAREITTHYDDQDQITGSTVKEAPETWAEPGGVDAGPERDGHSGYLIKGVSTYYDAEGNQRGQWVKTKQDDATRFEAIRGAFAAMAEGLPRLSPLPAPKLTAKTLLNLYTMTDCHVGMLAWHKEGGADWDLRIAERTLTGCFEQMVAQAPAAETCIVNQLGDWMHFDSMEAVTPTHRHLLDADGRFQKVVEASLRILRRLIDMALLKHERVIVIMAEGNHDLASSVWMRVMFAALYENEPRVQIDDSALPYYVYQHGSTMLGFHHGHLKKNSGIASLFAAQFPVIWGATAKRYAHGGHNHHERVEEFPGMKHVQHPTLAARDAYAARGGWFSERQSTAYTYHVEHGQVASVTVTPEMLAA